MKREQIYKSIIIGTVLPAVAIAVRGERIERDGVYLTHAEFVDVLSYAVHRGAEAGPWWQRLRLCESTAITHFKRRVTYAT